jgi:tetratricopeptide (TPR) repeat protein
MKTLTQAAIFFIIIGTVVFLTSCSKGISKEYKQLLEESQQLIEEAAYDLALEKAEAAIKLDADAPEAYVQKGFIHISRNEINQAGEAFNFVRNHLEQFTDEEAKYAALLNLGNYDYMLKDNVSALRYFLEAKEIHKTDTTLLNAIGLIYISMKDYETAKMYYNEVIDLDQQSFYAYANLATIHFNEGDFAKAISQINTALSINPRVPQFYFIKSDIEEAQGNLEQGIKTMSDAIASWSELGDAYYKRGNLYLKQQDYLSAIVDFSYAKDAGILEAALGMGYAYNGLSQYTDAIDAFKAYEYSIEGVDLKVKYEIGVAYYQIEDYTSAIASIDELLTLEPQDTEALLLKAYSLEQQQRYDDAYQVLESIVAIEPTHARALKEMAFIDDNKLR